MALLKPTLSLWLYAIAKIPLIAFVRPSVLKIDGEECEIKIPLNRWTRNHLGSMYFGTLAVGADCAGGLIALEAIRRSKKKVVLVFKDFHADFLKRPEGDVHFRCHDGKKIRDQVAETLRTGKRVTRPLHITAYCPKQFGDEPVAQFVLGLSLKASDSSSSKS